MFPRTHLVLALLAVFAACPCEAKKVICISAPGDHDPVELNTFLYNHEGYERALGIGATDKIQLGGSFTDCLSQVMSGDELVIVAHGRRTGEAFAWRDSSHKPDTEYTGFGMNPGEFPVPPHFPTLMNVKIRFCTCWSKRDPDGPGPNTALTTKLVNSMGGTSAGHSVTGFTGTAKVGAYSGLSGGTDAQKATAQSALRADPSYGNHPPVNRPGSTTNQRTAAQDIVDQALGTPGKVTVLLPAQVAQRDAQGNLTKGGYGEPFEGPVLSATTAGPFTVCESPDPPGCGCGFMDPGAPAVPIASFPLLLAAAMVLLAAGSLALRTRQTLRYSLDRFRPRALRRGA